MILKDLFLKYKTLIIIILLFLLVFFLRAEAINIGGVPVQEQSYYQDQNGLPYFSEMDSYYNLRMAQDFLNHGYLGDTKVNGVKWDLHSSFPPGKSAEYPPLIAYLTTFTYKFINLFTHVNLEAVAFWIAPLIASLVVIPAYLMVRKITNDYGGVTAGILMGLSPSYFSHTFAGFFDTDIFNVLMPLLVIWSLVMSVFAKDMKTRTIFASLSAISMAIFSLAWEGWWYTFYLVIGTIVLYLLVSKYLFKYKPIKSPKNYKYKWGWFYSRPEITSFIVFIILSLVLLSISLGITGLFSALTQSLQVSQLTSNSSYPNVYISVSELKIPSIIDVTSGVGGYVPFFFGILGIFALIWKLKNNEDTKEKRPDERERSNRKTVEENSPEKDNNIIKTELLIQKKYYLFTLYSSQYGY